MLPAPARLRRRDEFTRAIRGGRRAGRGSLVVHWAAPTEPAAASGPARIGFIVSRAVGNAVVRHQVVRRLRHLMRDRLPLIPPGSRLVVRALPTAATRSSAALGRDLDDALRRLRAHGAG